MRLTSKSAPGHYKVYVYCRQINYLSFNCYKRARSVDYLSRKRSKDSGLNYDVCEDGGQIAFLHIYNKALFFERFVEKK